MRRENAERFRNSFKWIQLILMSSQNTYQITLIKSFHVHNSSWSLVEDDIVMTHMTLLA